jgi:hypothetical protein
LPVPLYTRYVVLPREWLLVGGVFPLHGFASFPSEEVGKTRNYGWYAVGSVIQFSRYIGFTI